MPMQPRVDADVSLHACSPGPVLTSPCMHAAQGPCSPGPVLTSSRTHVPHPYRTAPYVRVRPSRAKRAFSLCIKRLEPARDGRASPASIIMEKWMNSGRGRIARMKYCMGKWHCYLRMHHPFTLGGALGRLENVRWAHPCQLSLFGILPSNTGLYSFLLSPSRTNSSCLLSLQI